MLNERLVQALVPEGMPVLDYLRDIEELRGTKQGCREGDCGACTVLWGRLRGGHLEYRPVTSCLMPMGDLEGSHLVTIEGFTDQRLTLVQEALVEEGAVQCGFCTPGLVMSLTGVLLEKSSVSKRSAHVALAGNLCRCTGYSAIKRAADRVVLAVEPGLGSALDKIEFLVGKGALPSYFGSIKARLEALNEKGAPRRKALTVPEGAVVVAGGTDVYVQRGAEMEAESLVRLFGAGLDEIKLEENILRVGAAATVWDLAKNADARDTIEGLADDAELICSHQVRSRATVAGNIVNASPIGDLAVMLVALDATLVVGPGDASRRIPIRQFYKGYKDVVLRPGELVASIEIPRSAARRFHFEKICKREHLDIASVNTACAVVVEEGVVKEVGLSAGGVAPTPLYLRKTSDFLRGRTLDAQTVRQAAAVAEGEVSPISDVRGSAAYKRRLLGNLVIAHFVELFGLEEAAP